MYIPPEFKIGDKVFFDDIICDCVNCGTIIKMKRNKIEVAVPNSNMTVIGESTEFFYCEHCAELTHNFRIMKRELKTVLNKF